jgi:alpha-tubulin suppressor-like RCC1 family protein
MSQTLRMAAIWLCVVAACASRESDASPPQRDSARATPREVSTADSVIAVAIGSVHACALTSSGAAYCWGKEGWRFGIGGDSDYVHQPMRIPGTTRFKSIAAGEDFNCALDMTGRAYCWGGGNDGELGGAKLEELSLAPRAVVGDHRFTAISAGQKHVCAIATDGAVWCWGTNQFSQLGDSATESSGTPVLVKGGHTFTQIAAGQWATCGVTVEHQAFCWGKLDQLPQSPIPSRVGNYDNLIAADAGTSSACALDDDGSVMCWGNNFAGQLGNGSHGETPEVAPRQVDVGRDVRFATISVGSARACALTRGGDAYCWGHDRDNLLGVTSQTMCRDGTAPCAPKPAVVAGVRFKQVSVGAADYICGVSVDASLYCWGRDLVDGPGRWTSPTRVEIRP